MGTALAFANYPLRPARVGIVGFGELARAHCRYLLADRYGTADESILMVFPGIRDNLEQPWPGWISDSYLAKAVKDARIVFVMERISGIQPIPEDKLGYAIETAHDIYRFEELYLEPATAPVSTS